MDVVLVTGSSGLVGSEVCAYFAAAGYRVHGVDNNQREVFFGPEGGTRWNQWRLERELTGFEHHELDVRDRHGILDLVGRLRPAIIVHTAAQPSHDRAEAIPSKILISTRWAHTTCSKRRGGGARRAHLST